MAVLAEDVSPCGFAGDTVRLGRYWGQQVGLERRLSAVVVGCGEWYRHGSGSVESARNESQRPREGASAASGASCRRTGGPGRAVVAWCVAKVGGQPS